jgi:aspartate/methionine/tyrosine aminotransferase
MEDFCRISRLPPYAFNIVRDMLIEARRRGEDIIDLGMGNPDIPTPKHIVAKLGKAKVATSPGIGFGEFGEGYVRFALIENEHRIRQAAKGIRTALSKGKAAR